MAGQISRIPDHRRWSVSNATPPSEAEPEEMLEESKMTEMETLVQLLPTADGKKAIKYLQNMASKPDSLLRTAGAVEAIVQAIRSHKADNRVIEEAFKVFQSASGSEDHRLAVTKGGGLQIVLVMLLSHPKDTSVIEEGCTVLRHLLVDAVHRSQFVKAGGVDILLQSMGTCSSSMVQASRALWSISTHPDHQAVIVKSDGIQALLEAVHDYEGQWEVMVAACGALRNICACTSRPNQREQVIKAGGILVPLVALSHHPANGRVVAQACALLALLVTAGGETAEHLQTTSIPYIMPALVNVMTSEEAMEQGCHVLWCIAHTKASLLLEAGAADLLSDVLHIHTTVDVLLQACGAVKCLSACETARLPIAQGGGVEALLAVMQAHLSSIEIMLQAAGALFNLSISSPIKGLVGQKGGMEIMVSALRSHHSDPALTALICALLARLAEQDANEELIADCGGIEAVMDVLRIPAAAVDVVIAAATVLRNCCSADATVQKMHAADGIHAIMTALRNHASSAEASLQCCMVLRCMLEVCDVKGELADCGAVDVARVLIADHGDQTELGQEAQALIDDLR